MRVSVAGAGIEAFANISTIKPVRLRAFQRKVEVAQIAAPGEPRIAESFHLALILRKPISIVPYGTVFAAALRATSWLFEKSHVLEAARAPQSVLRLRWL